MLAAANSVFGRWDETKGEEVSSLVTCLSFICSRYILIKLSFFFSFCLQNIDFMPTILSRFDMIFIVKDEHEQNKDMVSYVQ